MGAPCAARRPSRPRDRRGRLSGARRDARRLRAPVPPGAPAPSASTRRRTSARSATRARSSRTTTSSRRRCARCASTASARSTRTRSRVTPRASTRSRRSSSSHKLPLLDGWNAERRAAAAYYSRALAGVGDLRLPSVAPAASRHGTSTSCGRPTRRAWRASSARAGSATGRHYPEAVHLSARLRVARPSAGRLPGRRVARARVPVAANLPGHHGASSSTAVAEASRDFFNG